MPSGESHDRLFEVAVATNRVRAELRAYDRQAVQVRIYWNAELVASRSFAGPTPRDTAMQWAIKVLF